MTDDLGGVARLQPIPGESYPSLADSANVLDRLDADLLAAGLVAGRLPVARLLFLAVVSRLFDRPVSVAIKGPSSGGKSWLLGKVLDFCPRSSYHAVSAGSERSLAYGKEPLRHRMLVLYEAEAMGGQKAQYLIRTLLSEGELVYETVESGPTGLKPKIIRRPGPTGLLTTTTLGTLHAENETRLLSASISDTPDAQRLVHEEWGAVAEGRERGQVDVAPWHDLGTSLEDGERRVALPFGGRLSKLLPPHALRLQRDFIAVISLVQAHALLHRATRERDDRGRIVGTVHDYGVVREIVEPIVSVGVGATVTASVRETVEAVETLGRAMGTVDQAALVELLSLNKSTISRRVSECVRLGYLINEEDRSRHPYRLVLGEAMPGDAVVLPLAEDLR